MMIGKPWGWLDAVTRFTLGELIRTQPVSTSFKLVCPTASTAEVDTSLTRVGKGPTRLQKFQVRSVLKD